MTNTIWRFDEAVADTVEIRTQAKLVRWLAAEHLPGAHYITLWAEVAPEDAVHVHKVYVRGTGHPMTGDEGTHIDTVVTPPGLVWHLFADDLTCEGA